MQCSETAIDFGMFGAVALPINSAGSEPFATVMAWMRGFVVNDVQQIQSGKTHRVMVPQLQ
ncbi:dihydroorotate dehydrogenase [Desulfovibrio ferrophilus]|uniref:Dihydroorotate dehydrogenase n=1 Tax=Desulfovibrio ferrophilus TaxID=241368 RepID=A0A2Z6B2H3_9BACT|nr:dihydroorotate dehydrogenase [Desulfovibrio ferrophilus]